MEYTLYYRNYLRYCNYNCSYCPFAKGRVNDVLIQKEKKYLDKFVNYIRTSKNKFRLFFAPRGELLIHEIYRQKFIELSHMDNVIEIVIQTNLSSSLNWLELVNKEKIILWTTYHPNQVELDKFFSQILNLVEYNIKFTIGIVGVKDNFENIKRMSRMLNTLKLKKPYFWINAYKDEKNYYSKDEIEFLTLNDPLFYINLENHISKNLYCKTGNTVFFVEFNGNIHRCWKDKVKRGNLYKSKLKDISKEEKCIKEQCTCFIGYSNLESLKLDGKYKTSVLGRMI